MGNKLIELNCLLLENNEILFNGRSLGFLSENEKEKFVIILREFEND